MLVLLLLLHLELNPNREPSSKLVFRARGLTKVYESNSIRVTALDNVDLDLFEGEFVVFLGPSGSGKSTLLNILGGLDRASKGDLFYREHDLVHSTQNQLTEFRRDHVGFVFQFYNLIPTLTAAENIRLVTEICTHTPMTPDEALDQVGLRGRADFFPAQMSGGEQQRVAIARAIAKRPDILLCDEPTGALDVETGKLVLQALVNANRQMGTMVAVITHNAAISGIADRVIRLASGRVRSVEVPTHRISVQDVEW